MADGLSALRLCVWLFDNGCIELFDIDYRFPFAFRTKQREVLKHSIKTYLGSGLVFADRTMYPFFILQGITPFFKKSYH